jgi:hypothetical protein
VPQVVLKTVFVFILVILSVGNLRERNDMTALRFRTSLALAGGTVPLDAARADIDAESGLLPLRAAAERKAENESPLVRTPVGAA